MNLDPSESQLHSAGAVVRFDLPFELGTAQLELSRSGIFALQVAPAPAPQQDDRPTHAVSAQQREWVDQAAAVLAGQADAIPPLDLHGTAFQRLVWGCIAAIPAGSTLSYRELAQAAGRPHAVRAVAQACAANPVAVLIPCHRVIRSDGGLGGYRWGLALKQALLAREGKISAGQARKTRGT